ncbi:class I SAM-dependent methyltransferase [Caulobacter sp. KR2-114]|uniref:class I SAM-dependent methyltransferase n=1 Tax=Caulobacter sp. KR2-114 TaxID=3400912 RepID=UPI003BFB7B85
MTEATAAANADQAAYWNQQAGPTWAAMQEIMDWQLAPLSRAAIDALAPREGEHILDIGCGAGATSLDLAWRIDPEGSVLGVDIAEPLLALARARADAAGYPQVRFALGDAQTHAFEPGAFDAAFSRFGVMFFADPTAAFRNIRRALRPGGRLAFVCWRAMADNPLMTLPMQAAAPVLDAPAAPPADPHAPGPFAFADGERVRRILSEAGFADIAVTAHDERIGARTLDDALQTALRVGPLGRALASQPDRRDAAVSAVREALAAHAGPDGVLVPSATWIVTARSPD